MRTLLKQICSQTWRKEHFTADGTLNGTSSNDKPQGYTNTGQDLGLCQKNAGRLRYLRALHLHMIEF